MSFNPEKPYNDLPLLPPKAEIETKAILKKVISAGRALAELKRLEEIGVLNSHKIGRENLYLNKKLYYILSK